MAERYPEGPAVLHIVCTIRGRCEPSSINHPAWRRTIARPAHYQFNFSV